MGDGKIQNFTFQENLQLEIRREKILESRDYIQKII